MSLVTFRLLSELRTPYVAMYGVDDAQGVPLGIVTARHLPSHIRRGRLSTDPTWEAWDVNGEPVLDDAGLPRPFRTRAAAAEALAGQISLSAVGGTDG